MIICTYLQYNMKKLSILFFILSLSIHHILAQGEINNWFFGNKAGLNFSTGSPKVITGSQLSTSEGCATISDAKGNLLFYTDGMTIWDRRNQVMANGTGLLGDPSSTSSGIIIPKPNSCDTFYVFTVDMQGGDALFANGDKDGKSSGLRYSEVDMKANGGYGAVTNKKNIPLLARTTEGLTAIGHANGTDYWVITHGWKNGNNGKYFSFLITPSGVNTSPIVSTTGPTLYNDSDGLGAIGYMRLNKQGTKLADTHGFTDNVLVISDFNSATGRVSNSTSIPIQINSNSAGPYGVEFSPNGEYLYCTEQTFDNNQFPDMSYLYQFDVTQSNIAATKKIIASQSAQSFGALQLGPDGNIYVAYVDAESGSMQYGSYLHKISNSDTYPQFVKNAVSLYPGGSAYGLPTFSVSFNQLDFTVESSTHAKAFCTNDKLLFTSQSSAYDQLIWDFGDPASGAANSSNLPNPSHTYTQSGTYAVTLKKIKCGKEDVVTKALTIRKTPVFDITDQTFCSDKPATLSPGINADTYLWSDGSTKSTNTISNSGNYWLQISKDLCTYQDTFKIQSNPIPDVDAGSDGKLTCKTTQLTLLGTSKTAGVSYAWTGPGIVSGANTLNPIINKSGTYTFTVTNPITGCKASDQVNVTQEGTSPDIQIQQGQELTCSITSIVLKGSSNTAGVTYSWEGPGIVSGQNTSTPTINKDGAYTLTITDPTSGCLATASVLIPLNNKVPSISINKTGDINCNNQIISIKSTTDATSPQYSWSGPKITSKSTDADIQLNGAGNYTLIIIDQNNGCSSTASEVVNIDTLHPDLTVIPIKHLLCMNDTVSLWSNSNTPNVTYHWQGPKIISTADTNIPLVGSEGNYLATVTASNGCQTIQKVTVIKDSSFTIFGSITPTICEGKQTGSIQTSISGGNSPFDYLWSNGEQNPQIQNLGSGTYTLTVSDQNNCIISQAFDVPAQSINLVASPDTIVAYGDSIQLHVESNINTSQFTYQWSPVELLSCNTCAEPYTKALTQDIIFSLIAQDANGCSYHNQIAILVKTDFDLFFPNAFSPNGDGTNDYFKPLGDTKKVKDFYLAIYNRWNQKVFETNDIHSGWNGFAEKNKINFTDNFMYYVKTTFITGKSKEYKGSIVILP